MKEVNEFYIVKEDLGNEYKVSSLDVISLDKISNIKVFLNGIEQTDFELLNGSLYFKENLRACDKIHFKYCIFKDVKVFTNNVYNKEAIFKNIASSNKFRFNSIYTFEVNNRNRMDKLSFITKFNPYLSSVKKIRMDTGELLDNIPDESICKYIYINSKEVIEKFGEDPPDVIPNYAKNWVRYKTCLDLVNAVYLSISGKYGVINKILGDVEVDKEIKLPYIKDMQSRFKDLLNIAEDSFGDSLTSTSTRKGNVSEYPYERSFF